MNDNTHSQVFVPPKTFFISQNDLDVAQNPPMCHDLERYEQVMKSCLWSGAEKCFSENKTIKC